MPRCSSCGPTSGLDGRGSKLRQPDGREREEPAAADGRAEAWSKATAKETDRAPMGDHTRGEGTIIGGGVICKRRYVLLAGADVGGNGEGPSDWIGED